MTCSTAKGQENLLASGLASLDLRTKIWAADKTRGTVFGLGGRVTCRAEVDGRIATRASEISEKGKNDNVDRVIRAEVGQLDLASGVTLAVVNNDVVFGLSVE